MGLLHRLLTLLSLIPGTVRTASKENMANDNPIEQMQVFEFHPKYNLVEEEPILSDLRLDSQPCPFASFVLPAFRFFRWLGICPSSFKFDKETHKFVHVKGSWLRRAIAFVLGALVALHCYGVSKLLNKQLENTTISAMHKILGVGYVFFMLSFFRAFLVNGELFKEILNALQDGYKVTMQIGCKFPPFWKIRLASACLMICYVLIALLYTAGDIAAQVDVSSDASLYAYFEKIADAELRVLSCVLEQDGNWTGKLSGPIKLTLGTIILVVHIWGSLSWGGAVCMNSLWGLMLWLLLRQFLQIVSKNSSRNTLEDIRRFNAITGIMDKYNEAYGWVILCCIFSGSVHFSMTIFQIFNENEDSYGRILALVAFLWFGLMLVASAQVHKTACDIVQVIKSRFQAEDLWIKYHGNCVETAQGLTLVLHEIQTNSIGFKGLGFFTCTYSFIGTVLSAIATYAIIVLQFQ